MSQPLEKESKDLDKDVWVKCRELRLIVDLKLCQCILKLYKKVPNRYHIDRTRDAFKSQNYVNRFTFIKPFSDKFSVLGDVN